MNQPLGDAGPETLYDWRYIFSVAMEHRREVVAANLIGLVAVLINVPVPLLMPMMVDEVLLAKPGSIIAFMNSIYPAEWHGPITYIGSLLVVTILLRLSSMLLSVWQTRQFTSIAKDMTYRMRREMLHRLERISMAEYETVGSGAVSSHFVTDVETVDQFVGSTLGKFFIAALTLIGTAAVLIWINWALGLFIVFMNPLVIYLTVVLGKKVKELKRRENSAFELFQQSLTETLDAIQQVRASNRERHYLGRVDGRAREVRDSATLFAWKSDAANRLSYLVFLVGFEIFRALSMLMVLFSDLSVGLMMAVFGYLWFMMAPVQEVLNIQYSYNSANAALSRINRLFKLRCEPVYPHNSDPFEGNDTVPVRVEDICFAYGDGPLVLDHLSLEIGRGEKVALVGASGGGKSTLVQVLLGLYPPNSGSVFFDGEPVTEIGMERVREHVAVVLQHPALFNESARMNLTLGREIPEDALWNALEIAQLKEDVAGLPNGLDTIIGRQGVRLSGGQRQRLAIARMILTDPKVVILDEATSSLDTVTESRLHAAMQAFLKQRTTLIVAHRLSAVKQANRVYVFDAGCIIEEGEHHELMESGGLYSRLYGHHQFT